MDTKVVPMPPVDDPCPGQPPADHLFPPQQLTQHPNPPTQPADQPYPPPGYITCQYPGFQAPVITQQPAAYQQTSSTTVVVNQQVVEAPKTRGWSSGLCGFCQDCDSFCMGLCCPSVLLMNVSDKMGEGCCFPCCFPQTALFGLRTKLRIQENIEGSLMDDYCAVQFCMLCVLCQLARELKHVGR